jgi:hypothetical protein
MQVLKNAFARFAGFAALALVATGCSETSPTGLAEFDVAEQVLDCDGERLGPVATRAALEWTDTASLEGSHDVERRIDRLAEAFAACGDRRGMFPVVYRPITHRAIEAANEGAFEDAAWAERLIVAFAARYLDALHASLRGDDASSNWRRYEDLAENDGVGGVRVAATGIAVHLLMDLPHALVKAESRGAHASDFERFGDELVGVAPALTAELATAYGVDAGPLFRGFFLGEWVDTVYGEGVTTSFVFQTVRQKAWRNRWLMQHGLGAIAKAEMAASLHTIDAAFAVLDAGGALDGTQQPPSE